MNNNKIGFRDVLAFTLLPGIVPRARSLAASGLGPIALLVALVFRAARLLPEGHPFLNPVNLGRFTTMNVMVEAGRHIWFNRYQLGQKNIDQMIVFGVIVLALGLLLMQFVTLLLALTIPSAMAFSFPGGASFTNPLDMFNTPAIPSGFSLPLPNEAVWRTQSFYDVGAMFLDRVFGVPGVFNSCIADGKANSCIGIGPGGGALGAITPHDPGTFPWPFHHAFHGILQFYSVGLLAVAAFMLIYFAMVVVIETAQTGTPFGKRFNPVWAPLRLVLAAGLLIPLSYGLNAGQYMVLYSAKWGANFATNGWIGFNQTIGQSATIGGAANDLIAKPQPPDPTALLHFISVMQACKTIEEEILLPRTAQLMLLDPAANGGALGRTDLKIKPYLVKTRAKVAGTDYRELTYGGMTYEDAVQWADGGDVVIRFGIQDSNVYKDTKGTVNPFCGELTIPTVVSPTKNGSDEAKNVAYVHEGAANIMDNYWLMLQQLIFERGSGDRYGSIGTVSALSWNLNRKISQPYVDMYTSNIDLPAGSEPTPELRAEMVKNFNERLAWIIADSLKREQENKSTPYKMNANLLVRGWMAAGVWYNRIAEMNGAFTTAAWNLPKPTLYPQTMRVVAEQKQSVDKNIRPGEVFNPYVQNQPYNLVFSREQDEFKAANTYWTITKWWQDQGTGFTSGTRGLQTGNPVLDLINFVFGTSGLFSIRENANVHPMAQLSSIGKALIERSVTLLGIGVLGTLAQPWMTGQFSGLRQAVEMVSGFAFTFLSIGAAAGFILFYVIPFLPFIYFFFAAAGWVKAIFEAMVGVPLWALAHIRIDGSGLPGDAAMGGYYMLLEIMLRPILIVVGLIASVTIYAASVQVMNDIFNVAVVNVSGVDMGADKSKLSLENIRGSIDVFFYTILYTILVYMLGMSSFKMIDLIPGSMTRWLGTSVSAFTDSGQSQASTLVGYGTMGSNMVFGQLAGAAQKGAAGISETLKSVGSVGQKNP